MGTKEMVAIQDTDGTTMKVELVTYLVNDDHSKQYIVYSQGEKASDSEEEIIYISRIVSEDGILKLQEIADDVEWMDVQRLLKKIANS